MKLKITFIPFTRSFFVWLTKFHDDFQWAFFVTAFWIVYQPSVYFSFAASGKACKKNNIISGLRRLLRGNIHYNLLYLALGRFQHDLVEIGATDHISVSIKILSNKFNLIRSNDEATVPTDKQSQLRPNFIHIDDNIGDDLIIMISPLTQSNFYANANSDPFTLQFQSSKFLLFNYIVIHIASIFFRMIWR